LDRLNNLAYHALAIAHFSRGDYQESANAARRAVQIQPSFSVAYCLLAAALAKLERLDQAKAAAQQVLTLEPSFSAGRYCVVLGLPAALAEPLTRAWLDAGLPE
jgi:adenylate cyclase